MATQLVDAVDAILAQCNDALTAGAYDILGEPVTFVTEAVEPDLKPHPEDTKKPWVRATIILGDQRKVTQNNASGLARYRRWGTCWIQIFIRTAGAASWTQAQRLATLIQSAYEGKRAADNDVVFTSAAIKEAQREGHWTRYDAKVGFYWDEIK